MTVSTILRTTGAVSIVIALLLIFSPAALCETVSLYVSPVGCDDWSGALPSPSPGGADGPLATLVGARNQIRKMKADWKETSTPAQPVTVFLREGNYRIEEPVTFTPEDSGTEEAPVTYTAFSGENPVISGGKEITEWRIEKIDGRGLWVADLPEVASDEWWFREVFVDGERKGRTRLPKEGFYCFLEPVDVTGEHEWSHGSLGAVFEEGDLREWSNLSEVEIVALTRWIETRMPIESLDMEKNVVTFQMRSTFRLENTRLKDKAARYYVENVFEELDEPGEWYLDRAKGMIFLVPRGGSGAAVDCPTVVAPVTAQLIRVVASPEEEGEPVRHLRFEGLTFRHAEWDYPEGDPGSVQAAFEVPGAVYFERAESCGLRECTVEQVGTYGVEVGAGCRNVEIARCTLRDLGGGGVKLGHGSSHSTVADCEIADGGKIYPSAVGVWIGNSGDNQVVHNHIHDFFYTGISVGWSWGYGPSDAVRNAIEYNHIHDIGQGVLSDMGGIYTLGIAEGTRLAHNLIHDVSSYAYGGWGIYPDEGSTHVTVENNIVYRTKTGGFHQHYGKENTIRNNIFAFAVEQQLQRSREEEHKSFDFVGNIVYWDQGVLLGSTWKNDHFFLDNNLYWNPDPSKIDFAGASFKEWQERGHDKNSRIADPLFVDPENGDFTLKPESPAFALGFEEIDTSAVGPREKVNVR